MRKVVALGAVVLLALALSGCASEGTQSATPTAAASKPAIDPTLIPGPPPASVIQVDPANFQQSTGDYVFRIGSGPTWCTISPQFKMAICEQSEVSTLYAPVPVPASCQYSYGYQVQLKDTKPSDGGDSATFPCMGSQFSDPSGSQTLLDGQEINVAPFSCYVAVDTARCENTEGAYIVLGPKAWALGQ
jgi:hypothetical protein